MKLIKLTAILLFLTISVHSQIGNPTFQIDFNQYTGAYTDYNVATANTDFEGIRSVSAGEIRGLDAGATVWPQRTKVGEGVLRAHFPAEMATGQKTGFIFDKGMPASEAAIMEYKLKFSKDFQWKLGGKLPGLGGGGIPVGCTTNLDKIQNGFSTRLMWRANGNLVVYTYFPNRDITKCGVDYQIFSNMKTEQWYTVRQELKLNTPGEYNGVMKMYVDNVLVLDKKDILFRLSGKSNVKIDQIVFHTYSGGSDDSDWWSTEDQWIYFDDFKVWANTLPTSEQGLQIKINEPVVNTNFAVGKSYKISATASGKDDIEKVEILVNGEKLAESITATVTTNWSPLNEAKYSISATVYTTSGETKTTTIEVFATEVFNGQLVFEDNFTRPQNSIPLANGGNPAVNYSTTTSCTPVVTGGGTSQVVNQNGINVLQLLSQHTGQTGNRTEVAAPIDYLAPFKPILSENDGKITWMFNIKSSRSSSGGTAGFSSTNMGAAVVLAANESNFNRSNVSLAEGYAVVLLKESDNVYGISLVKFKNGLNARDFVTIAGPSENPLVNTNWCSVIVEYTPQTNTWKLGVRDDSDKIGDLNIRFPSSYSGNNNEYTNIKMTHFGFVSNTPNVGTTGASTNAFNIANYKVFAESTSTNIIKNELTVDHIRVYPNPTKGQIQIILDSYLEAEYTIYNSLGMKLDTGKFNSNTSIKLNNPTPGILILQVKTSNKIYSKKVFVDL